MHKPGLPMSPSPYMTYELAAGRWWRAKERDRFTGANTAADLVGPMRAAWAALQASKVLA